jgi:hypothetical protein
MELRIFDMFWPFPREIELERARGGGDWGVEPSISELAVRARGTADGDFDRGFSALPLAPDFEVFFSSVADLLAPLSEDANFRSLLSEGDLLLDFSPDDGAISENAPDSSPRSSLTGLFKLLSLAVCLFLLVDIFSNRNPK